MTTAREPRERRSGPDARLVPVFVDDADECLTYTAVALMWINRATEP
jgi:hypothetical protein